MIFCVVLSQDNFVLFTIRNLLVAFDDQSSEGGDQNFRKKTLKKNF